MKKKLSGLQKSWTMYSAALLLVAPELLTFLPTVKDQMPPELYSWVFKTVIGLFVLLRIKTQVQK
jgi:hypothetical protein